jgi:hypothetical protein
MTTTICCNSVSSVCLHSECVGNCICKECLSGVIKDIRVGECLCTYMAGEALMGVAIGHVLYTWPRKHNIRPYGCMKFIWRRLMPCVHCSHSDALLTVLAQSIWMQVPVVHDRDCPCHPRIPCLKRIAREIAVLFDRISDLGE